MINGASAVEKAIRSPYSCAERRVGLTPHTKYVMRQISTFVRSVVFLEVLLYAPMNQTGLLKPLLARLILLLYFELYALTIRLSGCKMVRGCRSRT